MPVGNTSRKHQWEIPVGNISPEAADRPVVITSVALQTLRCTTPPPPACAAPHAPYTKLGTFSAPAALCCAAPAGGWLTAGGGEGGGKQGGKAGLGAPCSIASRIAASLSRRSKDSATFRSSAYRRQNLDQAEWKYHFDEKLL